MRLHLKNLKIPVSLGVHEWEKHQLRRIRIDIYAEYDATLACSSDNLTDTVDYAALERTLVGVATQRHYQLVEALAAELGRTVLEHPQIESVTVEIEKPGVLAHAESAVLKETFTR